MLYHVRINSSVYMLCIQYTNYQPLFIQDDIYASSSTLFLLLLYKTYGNSIVLGSVLFDLAAQIKEKQPNESSIRTSVCVRARCLCELDYGFSGAIQIRRTERAQQQTIPINK